MTLDVRELIRRLRAGESNRAVARALSIARQTVGRYRAMARAMGWLEGDLPTLDALDRELVSMMAPSNLPRQPFKAAIHRPVIERLREEGVGMQAIYQRLCEDHGYPGSYSALRRYVIHLEGATPKAFVRIETAPGEEAQVDFGAAGLMVTCPRFSYQAM
jgi:hypothetical protein